MRKINLSDFLMNEICKIGLSPTPNDACRLKCEKFICALFSAAKKMLSTSDELRYLMFCRKDTKVNFCPYL